MAQERKKQRPLAAPARQADCNGATVQFRTVYCTQWLDSLAMCHELAHGSTYILAHIEYLVLLCLLKCEVIAENAEQNKLSLAQLTWAEMQLLEGSCHDKARLPTFNFCSKQLLRSLGDLVACCRLYPHVCGLRHSVVT